jgi:hypothetical protein
MSVVMSVPTTAGPRPMKIHLSFWNTHTCFFGRFCGLATDPGVRVLFPALPDFLRSSGSGTWFTQPHENNWGATWKEKQRLWSRKPKDTAVGICHADHVTPSTRKSWH